MKADFTLYRGGGDSIPNLKFITTLFLILFCFIAQAQNEGDYRTIDGGSWNIAAKWQVYKNGEWKPAEQYPGENGTEIINEVTIRPCHIMQAYIQKTYYNIKTLKIQGQLTLDNKNITFTAPLEEVILDGGAINWLKNADLYLPQGCMLSIFSPGSNPCTNITPGLQSNNCTGSQRLLIGGILYATCQGANGQNPIGGHFSDVNASNGSIAASPLATHIGLCEGSTIRPQLLGRATRYNLSAENISYEWRLVSKPTGSAFVFSNTFTQDPLIPQVFDLNGDYVFGLTVKATVGSNTFSPPEKEITINVGGSSTFDFVDGIYQWDNGIPSAVNHRRAIINYNYYTSTRGSFDACSCEVNNGTSLVIEPNTFVKLENELINNGYVSIHDGGNLIQVNDMIPNSGNNIEVRKNFTFSTERKQYNLVISPVVGQNLKNIYPGATTTAMYYREADNYFYNHTGNYTAGQGLAVKEPIGGSTSARFYGLPFNGDLNYNLAYSGAGKGFNLIGNPYPSTLDIDAFYADNSTRISATFYFWDNRGNIEYVQQGSNYNGSNYAIYNAASRTGLSIGQKPTGSGLPTDKVPNQFVKPGTAFIVQATSAGSSVQFKNAYRLADNSGPSYTGKGGNFTAEMDRYWLSLETPAGLEYTNAVVYLDNGQNVLGLEDSEAMGTSDEIFTLSDNTELAINGRAPFELSDVIPLGVSHFAEGSYTITIQKAEGIFNVGQPIYLKDKTLNVVHNLSEGPYEYTSAAGKFTNRFEILYQYTPEEENQNPEPEGNQITISKQGNFFVVNSSIDKISEVEIYNLDGRQVYKRKNINSQSHKIQSNSLEKSVLFVHILTDTGERIIKSIINN